MWTNYNFDYSNTYQAQDFEEVPAGKYLVNLKSMELGATRKGLPMIKACFNIKKTSPETSGTNRSSIFVNLQIVRSFDGSTNDNFMISRGNSFLESFGIVSDVQLKTLSEYESLVAYIAQKVIAEDKHYILTVIYDTAKNGKQYVNYKLEPVYSVPPAPRNNDNLDETIPF